MPYEFTVLNLIRALEGAYTAAELEQLPAQLVERWLIYLSEEAKESRNPTKK